MNWLSTLKDLREKIWPDRENAKAVASFSYHTITHLFNQVGVIPRVVHSAVLHEPTNKVARHLARIFIEDLTPLVLVTYASKLIQDKGLSLLEDEPDNPGYISTASAIQLSLYLLQAATLTYWLRAKIKLFVRTAIVIIEAPAKLNSVNTSPPMTVCIEANCSTLRVMQGTFRSIFVYYLTNEAISMMEPIPIVGSPIASALFLYHNGSYVVMSDLPEICDRHHKEYLNEHPELVLSAGLSHAAATWLINTLIETSTGIPIELYKSTVADLMLIIQMSVTAHLILPKPVLKSTREIHDPIGRYKAIIGFIFDTFLSGLKIKIPGMLGSNQSTSFKEKLQAINWPAIYQSSILIQKHPLARVILPSLVQSSEAFIRDPIVSDNWLSLRNKSINVLRNLQSAKDRLDVKLATYAPDSAATLVEFTLGTPQALTKELLTLLNDEDVLAKLREWQYQLERLTLAPQVHISPNKKALALRGQAPVETEPLLTPVGHASFPPAKNVIRERHATQNKAPSMASLVIRHRYPTTQVHEIGNQAAECDSDWVDVSAEERASQNTGVGSRS